MKRLNVAVPEDIHKRMKIAVAKESTTITQFVIDAILEKLEKSEVKEGGTTD